MSALPAKPPSRRFDLVDAARGAAIAAMVAYHFSWDLTALQFIATDVTRELGWKIFARSIAASFLVLVGIGLALAHREGFRRGPFLRRLAKVGGAALAITVATYFAFPQSYIFFGILHCIALGSVLALPFLRAPGWAIAAAAAICLAAPWVLTDPAFDAPALGFLGLGTEAPTTNDYVPLFPWLAPILVGIALGRPLARGAFGRAGAWHASNPVSRALVWAGRWSLPIYLTHQLVLFGGLYALREAIGPNPVALCVQECVRRSGDSARCRVSCTCVVGALRERGALGRIMTGPPSEPDRAILDDARQMCARAP